LNERINFAMPQYYLISNQQLGVRPLTVSDTGALFSVVRLSIESLSHWMRWCKPDYSREDAANWTAHCEDAWNGNREFPQGIFQITTGQLVSCTGVDQISQLHSMGNIGYWVGTPYRGCVYATTAALMSADFAFTDLGLTRAEIIVLTENATSQRVAENTGTTREGVARNRLYFHGKPADAVVYSLIPQYLLGNERVCCLTRFFGEQLFCSL
jgi:RimJ/RimL family protein N-acetyltransferase